MIRFLELFLPKDDFFFYDFYQHFDKNFFFFVENIIGEHFITELENELCKKKKK